MQRSTNRSSMLLSAAFGVALLTLPLAAYAETRIEKRLELDAGGTFHLESDTGSVRIVGGAADAAEIVLTSRRDDFEERYEASFESTGDEATVRVERRKGASRWGWKSDDSIHFEVRLPRAVEVSVATSGGRIDLATIDGNVALDTSGGSIHAKEVRGNVLADTSGGAIDVSEVEGDVRADTSGGPITVSAVTGDVVADTSGGGITLREIGGDIVADTSGGGIEIAGAGGGVKADTSGGSVRVSFATGNASGGTLSTSGGGITAAIDPAAALDIDASSSGGSVRSDLPLMVQGTQSRTILRGALNGGGATLKLRTSGGGIRIESL